MWKCTLLLISSSTAEYIYTWGARKRERESLERRQRSLYNVTKSQSEDFQWRGREKCVITKRERDFGLRCVCHIVESPSSCDFYKDILGAT